MKVKVKLLEAFVKNLTCKSQRKKKETEAMTNHRWYQKCHSFAVLYKPDNFDIGITAYNK